MFDLNVSGNLVSQSKGSIGFELASFSLYRNTLNQLHHFNIYLASFRME